MFVCSGELLTSFQGDMAMGKVLTLLRCSWIQGRPFGRLSPRDKDAMLLLLPTIPLLEATALTGQTLICLTTANIPSADPTCRPGHSNTKISTSGLPSISLVQPTRVRSSRSNNQAARPLDPSSTRRDLTIHYLLPSVQESILTTGSATVMYVTFIFHKKSVQRRFSRSFHDISFRTKLCVALARCDLVTSC